jgi:hypothetical protein
VLDVVPTLAGQMRAGGTPGNQFPHASVSEFLDVY